MPDSGRVPPESPPCAALILAAGASTRMGRPKSLLRLEGGGPGSSRWEGVGPSVLERMVTALRLASFSPILVVIGAEADQIRKAVREEGFSYVVNEGWTRGRTSSVKAGLSKLVRKDRGVLVWPVDHPFVSLATLIKLLDGSRTIPGDWFVPTFEGRRGHPPLMSGAASGTVLGYEDDRPLHEYPYDHPTRVVEIPVDDPFVVTNLDTLEDFERARISFASSSETPR